MRLYGHPRPVVRDVVESYLKCGDLREGFARIRCPDCRYEYLLAFSCRGRWSCPSCHAKRVIKLGEQPQEAILSAVPHRQYVFSISKILRLHLKYNRTLLIDLCCCANQNLKRFFRTALNLPEGEIGAVTAIQTFGDYCVWHPPLHILAADGQEALAQYNIRNTFSLEKIRYQRESGTVIYISKMTHGKNRRNFKVFTPRDYITTITQHILEKSFQLVGYYGW